MDLTGDSSEDNTSDGENSDNMEGDLLWWI
jgi:hypothetical protein